MAEKKIPVNLKIDAPRAGSVYVAGTFNDWSTSSYPLKELKGGTSKGVWQRMLYLKPGEYEYRFVVDGVWQDDPNASSEKRMNEFGTYNDVLRV